MAGLSLDGDVTYGGLAACRNSRNIRFSLALCENPAAGLDFSDLGIGTLPSDVVSRIVGQHPRVYNDILSDLQRELFITEQYLGRRHVRLYAGTCVFEPCG